MAGLIADVGGTNTRFARVVDGRPVDIRHFANADFPDFDAVLAQYLGPGEPCSGAAIAVAGPVTRDGAQLTNRGWMFSREALEARIGGPVQLVNDLVALGRALPHLGPGQYEDRGAGQPVSDAQMLAVNLGTGFNLCPVLGGAALEAEYGYAGLPVGLADLLRTSLGEKAAAFQTVEDVISGRGFPEVFLALTGKRMSMAEIAAAAELDDAAAMSGMALLAEATGLVLREAVFQYLPRGGLFLAGSVARAMLSPQWIARVLAPVRSEGPFQAIRAAIPVRLIVDDKAPLFGLAEMLPREGPDPQKAV